MLKMTFDNVSHNIGSKNVRCVMVLTRKILPQPNQIRLQQNRVQINVLSVEKGPTENCVKN